MSWRAACVAIICGFGITSCATHGGIPFEPPLVYKTWWQEAQDCLGVEGSFERIRWYVQQEHNFLCAGVYAMGCWHPNHHIVIAARRRKERNTIVHEMLHDLLGGDPNHAHAAFLDCTQ